MRIELHLFASLRQYLPDTSNGGASTRMEVDEGTTVQEVLDRLSIPPHVPKLMFINGIHAQGDTVLQDGDRVGVFPPIAGG